jgi:ankyrin repeat protein
MYDGHLGGGVSELVDAFIQAACVPLDKSHASGSLDAAREILVWHPEVAAADIHSAAILGNDSAVRQYLQVDSQHAVARGGPYGWDALTYLCFSRFLRLDKTRSDGFLRAATALLQAGADPNTGFYSDEHLPSPTFESALYGAAGVAHHAGLTQLLIDQGADPNDGETEYHAPEGFDNRAMEIIVESGRLNPMGLTTMLHRKLDWTDYEGVAWLLEHGANANAVSHWGHRALDHAVGRDNPIRFFDVLLDYGADPRLMTGEGVNAFIRAAAAGRADVLDLFARRGFAFVLEGDPAFLAACARGDAKSAARMAGDDPDLVDRLKRERPETLPNFAGAGNTGGVKILLDHGFDIEERARGQTALHLAIWRERLPTVKLLLTRGASVDAKTSSGENALALAERAMVEMSEWTPHETSAVLREVAKAANV